MPTQEIDEQKDDFDLLRALILKHQKIEDKPDVENDYNKQLERFISQLHIVSQKILKDYQQPVSKILQKWKEEEDQSSSDESGDSRNE